MRYYTFSSLGAKIGRLFCEIGAYLIVVSCGVCKPTPIAENNHHLEVRDSVRIKDSLVIHSKSVYKDYGSLLDTLRITDERATMTAWADTTHNILAGKLEVQPSQERTRVEYRDREVHDTTYVKEPFEVEVEKVVAPKIFPWSLALNFVGLALLGMWIFFKVKYKRFKTLKS